MTFRKNYFYLKLFCLKHIFFVVLNIPLNGLGWFLRPYSIFLRSSLYLGGNCRIRMGKIDHADYIDNISWKKISLGKCMQYAVCCVAVFVMALEAIHTFFIFTMIFDTVSIICEFFLFFVVPAYFLFHPLFLSTVCLFIAWSFRSWNDCVNGAFSFYILFLATSDSSINFSNQWVFPLSFGLFWRGSAWLFLYSYAIVSFSQKSMIIPLCMIQ